MASTLGGYADRLRLHAWRQPDYWCNCVVSDSRYDHVVVVVVVVVITTFGQIN